MNLLLLSLALVLGAGAGAVVLGPWNARWAARVGAWGSALGCALGLVPAVRGLSGVPVAVTWPWQVPGGSLSLGLDPLSAVFLVPVLALSAVSAVYGERYLRESSGQAGAGYSWFFYNLLVAGMVLVVLARDGLFFLVAWEIMSLSAFFLVTAEHSRSEVRSAGRVYIIATHLGTAALFPLFLMLGQGSLDFSRFANPTHPSALFLLALVGFGTKAGLVPFHVWLPEAHPAAPSHVSAVMSGVMIKTGIYGLARTLTFLGTPPAWWGWTLLAVGGASGVLGVLFALAQHDLKRLLAYHSVENIGIIVLGLGIGVLGLSSGSAVWAALGFGGALLHVVNHATFKGLLFLGAGAVSHGAHTLEIDALGGLLRRMPRTGVAFLIGSVAITALPPLNGFVSEYLIYRAGFSAVVQGGDPALGGALVIGALALIGGLAAACFAKAFGVAFLGEPRSPAAGEAEEVEEGMWMPMMLLAGVCVAIGLGAPAVLPLLGPAVATLVGPMAPEASEALARSAEALRWVSGGGGALIAVAGLIALVRARLLAGRQVGRAGTWDCGYVDASPRRQYTASSFAQPLLATFAPVLGTKERLRGGDELFPRGGSFRSHTPDRARVLLFAPLYRGLERVARTLRVIQSGQTNLYVLYIAVTLAVLLVWKLL